jgi:hypothetical protein
MKIICPSGANRESECRQQDQERCSHAVRQSGLQQRFKLRRTGGPMFRSFFRPVGVVGPEPFVHLPDFVFLFLSERRVAGEEIVAVGNLDDSFRAGQFVLVPAVRENDGLGGTRL